MKIGLRRSLGAAVLASTFCWLSGCRSSVAGTDVGPGANGNAQTIDDTSNPSVDRSLPPPGRPITYASKRFDVIMHFEIEGDATSEPTVIGSTNLPDGTKLYVRMSRPYPACRAIPNCVPDVPANGEGDSLFGTLVTVRFGKFIAGPHWRSQTADAGWPRVDGMPGLQPGRHIVEVRLPPDDPVEPNTSLAAFGRGNVNLYGPSATACCYKTAEIYGDRRARDDMAAVQQQTSQYGPTLYFAQEIDVK